MWRRLEDEREARRRARIFSFPQQLAALKDVLNQFVTEVFGGTRMDRRALLRDRKSTRLNSSHLVISYAVFCLKKKKVIVQSLQDRLHRHVIITLTQLHYHSRLQCPPLHSYPTILPL